MKIRWKSLLILGLITFTLMASLYIITQSVTFGAIAASENEDATLNAVAFQHSLNIDLSGLNGTVEDWAKWDDTYNFIQNNNTQYIESNLFDETFVTLRLNIMLYFDESRQLVFGKMYDYTNQIRLPLNEQTVEKIASENLLFTTELKSGFILLNNTPLFVAASPILTSQNEGPSKGTLIIGRSLDESELNVLANALGLPVSIATLNNQPLPEDFSEAFKELSTDKTFFAEPLNETFMSGFTLIQGVNGTPVAIAKIDAYRTAYVQGVQSTTRTGISFIVIGVIVFVAISVLLEELVISRVSTLDQTVARIRETGDKSKRVIVEGHDEISSLSENVNGMLGEIEKHTQTLEKRVEERTHDLFENQEKLKGILSASPDAIVATDLDGNITECNNQMTNLCGSQRSDLLGNSALKFLIEDDTHRLYESLTNIVQNNRSIVRIECKLLKKDGSTYPAEISLSIIRDTQNLPAGFVAIVRDLTERKMLEERLIKSERFAAIGELSGMVGHDLRNPLTAIRNATYFLRKKCVKCQNTQSGHMLDIIDKSIDHANRIVNDLLDYSREIRLELSECTPHDLLHQALLLVKIPENIKVLDQVTENIRLEADENKLVRVFLNLIKNAFDAMPKGGNLEIRSTLTEQEVNIVFIDSGEGMSEETKAKIFTPLFTTKAQGMGFGLPICKRIVEAHGGRITIESKVGDGTDVTVTLPAKLKAEALA